MLERVTRWIEEEELGSGELLFPDLDKAKLRYAWECVRKKAGVSDVHFHDLRHTYAVHCTKAGMPIVELQQRLGHANITMTQRYAVYAPPIAFDPLPARSRTARHVVCSRPRTGRRLIT